MDYDYVEVIALYPHIYIQDIIRRSDLPQTGQNQLGLDRYMNYDPDSEENSITYLPMTAEVIMSMTDGQLYWFAYYGYLMFGDLILDGANMCTLPPHLIFDANGFPPDPPYLVFDAGSF